MLEDFAGCYFGGWRQVYFVLWILPSPCHPLGRRTTQLGKLNPTAFTKRLWWPQSRGGLRCALRVAQRQDELPAKAIPKTQEHAGAELGGPASRVGCQDGVCVGLEFGSFVIWIFPKVRAGEGTSLGCTSFEGDAPQASQPASPSPPRTQRCLLLSLPHLASETWEK